MTFIMIYTVVYLTTHSHCQAETFFGGGGGGGGGREAKSFGRKVTPCLSQWKELSAYLPTCFSVCAGQTSEFCRIYIKFAGQN